MLKKTEEMIKEELDEALLQQQFKQEARRHQHTGSNNNNGDNAKVIRQFRISDNLKQTMNIREAKWMRIEKDDFLRIDNAKADPIICRPFKGELKDFDRLQEILVTDGEYKREHIKQLRIELLQQCKSAPQGEAVRTESEDDRQARLKAELDSKIPDRDYAEFVIGTIKRTVNQEDSLVRLIVYTALSKDSAHPINLAVLAPTSEGKTYAVLESIGYFSKQDVRKIGSMTPKVIIRQNGVLIDSDNQPIEGTIKELKRAINKAKGDAKEDLQEQLNKLYSEAKVLIDLRGKLWVFLEPPHHETWTILKPILSHDDFEIEHPYVYEVQNMGFSVKRVVTRGWPACIFCSAKDESKWPVWPEIQSRFIITSPNMVQQKYRDGNMLIAQRMGLPQSSTAIVCRRI